MKRIVLLSVLVMFVLLFLSSCTGFAAEDPAAVTREIQRATHFVTLFEKELDQQRGGLAERYLNKTEATNRVRSLHERYPDDPRVQALFERVRTAIMRSKGDYITITPEMLAYRQQEKKLQETLGALADARWKELLQEADEEAKAAAARRAEDRIAARRAAEAAMKAAAEKAQDGDTAEPSGEEAKDQKGGQALVDELLARQRARERDGLALPVFDAPIVKLFPTPDWQHVSIDDIRDAVVVLTDVRFPEGQFMGAGGEYIALGKPSSGYWYVEIDGRNWLGPWEAMKRARREAVGALDDVKGWTVLGRVTSVSNEIPQAGEQKTMAPQMGWVVTPVAIHAPGLLTAWYDPEAESSGTFAGERDLKQIKERGYTIKALPANATPEQVMETFVTAIKEKNRDLYMVCVNPERYQTAVGRDLVANYHWDLHQHRFKTQYVAVTFGKPRIVVVKGFDEKNSDDDYFLTDEQKDTARRIGGERLEFAYVDCKAWDENGRQYGTPKQYQLVRKNGGPWLVESYAVPF